MQYITAKYKARSSSSSSGSSSSGGSSGCSGGGGGGGGGSFQLNRPVDLSLKVFQLLSITGSSL